MRFRNSNYNQYASTPPKRHDGQFILTTSISRPLSKHFTLTASHVFEDVAARNNLYEYYRNLYSLQLSCIY